MKKVGIRVILGKNWPKTVIFHHFTLFLGSMTQCRHFSPLSSQAKPIQLFELYNSSLWMPGGKVGIRVILGKNWPKTVTFHHFILFLACATQCRHLGPLSRQVKPTQLFGFYNCSLWIPSEKSGYQDHIGLKLPEKCDFQHFTLFLAFVPNVDIWVQFRVKRKQ